MAKWTTLPQAGQYGFSLERLRKHWGRLHQGDAEALPKDAAVLEAWALFHGGEFQKAAQAGIKAGGAGLAVANKATSVYATYLEKKEGSRLALYQEVAQRACSQLVDDPDNASAHYWQAFALGRYSHGISVAKALAQGLGGKVKAGLEIVIALQPRHADAHLALGAFHAEVIDKVGSLIGNMTYGAKKTAGIKLFQQGLALNPNSALAMVEYANALVVFEGDQKLVEATQWYEKAADFKPLDAAEWLDVEMARVELED